MWQEWLPWYHQHLHHYCHHHFLHHLPPETTTTKSCVKCNIIHNYQIKKNKKSRNLNKIFKYLNCWLNITMDNYLKEKCLCVTLTLPYPLMMRYLSIACTRARGSILTAPPFHCFNVVQEGCFCSKHWNTKVTYGLIQINNKPCRCKVFFRNRHFLCQSFNHNSLHILNNISR